MSDLIINNFKFIKAFFRNPREIGAIIPSSEFLAEKVVNEADFSGAKCVVEFGSGTGAVTRKIMEKLPKDAILICFEINKELARLLKADIKDKRVKVINDGAENAGKYLKKYGFESADLIFSSLPMAWIPKNLSSRILETAERCLKDDGRYIQFQYSLLSRGRLKKTFSDMKIKFEIRNFPPAFVYVCEK